MNTHGVSTIRLSVVALLCVTLLAASLGLHLVWAGPPGPSGGETVPGISTPTQTSPGPVVAPPVVLPAQTGAPVPPTSTPLARPLTCGLLTDFEPFGTWRRGVEAYGTFTQSSEQAYSGSFSGKLTYTFPTQGNDYVVFQRNIPMGGYGKSISAQVYGDGQGHYLNVWVRDAQGEVWQFTFGQITHTGWQLLQAPFDVVAAWPAGHVSGPANGVIDYPINFRALVLDDAPDTYTGMGAIFIDDLSCVEMSLLPGPVVGPTTGTVSAPAGAACRIDLLEPHDNSHFGPSTERVTLSWQLDRPLAPNEYFFVNVPYPHGGTTWYDGTWIDPSQQKPDGTLDSHWTLRDYLCMPGFSDSGWYDWTVAVKVQSGFEKTMDDVIVCESSKRSFEWTGCYPSPTPTEDIPYP